MRLMSSGWLVVLVLVQPAVSFGPGYTAHTPHAAAAACNNFIAIINTGRLATPSCVLNLTVESLMQSLSVAAASGCTVYVTARTAPPRRIHITTST